MTSQPETWACLFGERVTIWLTFGSYVLGTRGYVLNPPPDPAVVAYINLATNTSLQRITLESIAHPNTCSLLSSIVFPYISTVKFESYVFIFDTETHYAVLERTLMSPNLSCVSEVQFVADGPEDAMPQLLERHAKALPELNRRGVLRVVPRG
ncbi:hypothetical protein EUX98_g9589 [Antrodiella citrinella]|uniref:Uncharacterized protein n=1 Tax=Antrodiella citrinella TaxID=2447956 RepID=A0A4V3XER1_9APHY|nr:hypothetical protein EUX98_g9589 [Antrodiella citrinella]